MKKVLAIVGPTAVGKTDLSIRIAQEFNGEIISGDSMQVYRKLNIGTAKITASEMQGIKHHLIDIRDVQERFSVADFKKQANQLIEEITSRGKLPMIVGGTGFYLQSVFEDLDLGGTTINSEQVEKVRLGLNQKSTEDLLIELKQVDVDSYLRIDHQNRRRLIRALEVYYVTGQKMSDQRIQNHPYDELMIGLNTDRRLLYDRINLRVRKMIEMGLEDEVRWLYQISDVPQARLGIGYREWESYFKNGSSLEETIEEIQKDSRHYAKRQLTWFRNKMDVSWFDLVQKPDEIIKIKQKIESWLTE